MASSPVKIWRGVLQIYGAMNFEGVHPQQCGYLRLKDRTQRRPEMPRVPALLFYPRYAFETLVKYARFARLRLEDPPHAQAAAGGPEVKAYRDLAMTRVVEAETEHLEMFELNDSSRAAVEKARKQAEQRKEREHHAAHADEPVAYRSGGVARVSARALGSGCFQPYAITMIA